jgi:hypothetical protein
MNDLLNVLINTKISELTILHLIILFIFVIISIFAFKIVVKLDVNKFLERRDRKLKLKIQKYCPHLILETRDKGVSYESYFTSPLGTTAWFCNKCGFATIYISDEEIRKIAAYYVKNPKIYLRNLKKTDKLIDKHNS